MSEQTSNMFCNAVRYIDCDDLPMDGKSLKCLLTNLKTKAQFQKNELESLGGLLSHCSHVVDGGRIHSRRFYYLSHIK